MVISPTQIDLWRSCQRKFAFTYLAGLPRPEKTKAMQIGIDLHGAVETYLKTGFIDYSTPDDASRLFPYVLPYLPPVGTPSETKVTVEADGVTLGGLYDWLDGEEVGDLKTTSNILYAKTPEFLSKHPQGLIYSLATGAKRGRWVYVQTRGTAKVKEVRFEPDYAALDDLISDAHAIEQAWSNKPDPNSLPPNTSACSAYGGCPFVPICKIDAGERLIALTRKPNNMSEFDDLIAKVSSATPSAPSSSAPNINPPAAEPNKVAQAMEKLTEEAQKMGVYEPNQDPPKKRGRPKKEESRKEEINHPAEAQDNDRPIDVLYVSCMPTGNLGECDFADYIFASARAQVNEKLGVDDYRFVEYGQGAGALLTAVTTLVRDIRPAQLIVDDSGPEARVCLAGLVAMSKKVIRRF